MPKPRSSSAREKRITYDIVVDAYTPEERALGWYYYLDNELSFPFQAECITTRPISPLKKGEKIQVVALAPEDDCRHEMFVLIQWAGRRLGAPLAQLKPIGVPLKTKRAIEDWRYWVEMGYEF